MSTIKSDSTQNQDDILKIISLQDDFKKRIDYVLYFETSLDDDENKRRKEICEKFLKQLEIFESINYQTISYNYAGDYILLNASDERLLEEAEKCQMKFCLRKKIV